MRTVRTVAACALIASLALAVAFPPSQAAAMSRPRSADEKSAASQDQAQPQSGKAFLWLNSISGWNAVDDEHIVLYGGPGNTALVTTFGPCTGLRYAETIAVKAPLSYLEGNAFGTIFFSEPGYVNRRCPIGTIEAVKDLKEAKALVASRKQQKAMESEKGSSAAY